MKVTLKKATFSDLKPLQQICTSTYRTYFKDYWIPPGIDLYLEEQFGEERLGKDLNNEKIGYFFIVQKEVRVGFIKVNYEVEFENYSPIDTCELEKIYLYPAFKGSGIGKIALLDLIEMLQVMGKKDLLLVALDTNESAISFYQKLGFKKYKKERLDYSYIKEELRGILWMKLNISKGGLS